MIKMIRLFLVFVTVMLVTGCATQTRVGAEGVVSQGKQQFKQGEYTEAYKTLLPIAEAGNAEAQYTVGYLYYYGKGVKKDKEIGIVWMRRAAAQDHPLAKEAVRILSEPLPVEDA